MKRIFTAAALVLCMALTSCGSDDTQDSSYYDISMVGGAKMKETTVTEAEEEPEESEEDSPEEDGTASQEQGAEEPDSEQEEEIPEEENEVPAYEDSLTAAFFDGLGMNSFMLNFDKYDVKSVEDMTLTASVSLLRYDRVVYERSQDSENTLTEVYYTPVGTYSQVSENGKVKEELKKTADDDGGAIVWDTLLLSQAKNGELVSSDEYSDGTVEEVFESESGERYVYTYFGETGVLMSVQSNDTTLIVTTFSENIDEIELPDEIHWSYPDPNNA